MINSSTVNKLRQLLSDPNQDEQKILDNFQTYITPQSDPDAFKVLSAWQDDMDEGKPTAHQMFRDIVTSPLAQDTPPLASGRQVQPYETNKEPDQNLSLLEDLGGPQNVLGIAGSIVAPELLGAARGAQAVTAIPRMISSGLGYTAGAGAGDIIEGKSMGETAGNAVKNTAMGLTGPLTGASVQTLMSKYPLIAQMLARGGTEGGVNALVNLLTGGSKEGSVLAALLGGTSGLASGYGKFYTKPLSEATQELGDLSHTYMNPEINAKVDEMTANIAGKQTGASGMPISRPSDPSNVALADKMITSADDMLAQRKTAYDKLTNVQGNAVRGTATPQEQALLEAERLKQGPDVAQIGEKVTKANAANITAESTANSDAYGQAIEDIKQKYSGAKINVVPLQVVGQSWGPEISTARKWVGDHGATNKVLSAMEETIKPPQTVNVTSPVLGPNGQPYVSQKVVGSLPTIEDMADAYKHINKIKPPEGSPDALLLRQMKQAIVDSLPAPAQADFVAMNAAYAPTATELGIQRKTVPIRGKPGQEMLYPSEGESAIKQVGTNSPEAQIFKKVGLEPELKNAAEQQKIAETGSQIGFPKEPGTPASLEASKKIELLLKQKQNLSPNSQKTLSRLALKELRDASMDGEKFSPDLYNQHLKEFPELRKLIDQPFMDLLDLTAQTAPGVHANLESMRGALGKIKTIFSSEPEAAFDSFSKTFKNTPKVWQILETVSGPDIDGVKKLLNDGLFNIEKAGNLNFDTTQVAKRYSALSPEARTWIYGKNAALMDDVMEEAKKHGELLNRIVTPGNEQRALPGFRAAYSAGGFAGLGIGAAAKGMTGAAVGGAAGTLVAGTALYAHPFIASRLLINGIPGSAKLINEGLRTLKTIEGRHTREQKNAR